MQRFCIDFFLAFSKIFCNFAAPNKKTSISYETLTNLFFVLYTKPHQASRLKAQYLPPQAEILMAEVADRSTPGVEPRADIQLSAQCAKFGNKMGKRLFLPLAPLQKEIAKAYRAKIVKTK